jgi:hypothetical protein
MNAREEEHLEREVHIRRLAPPSVRKSN